MKDQHIFTEKIEGASTFGGGGDLRCQYCGRCNDKTCSCCWFSGYSKKCL